MAIKTVVQSDIKAEADFLREINMLKFVSRDRNIVQFYGACRRNNQLWLVTEYMEVPCSFLNGLLLFAQMWIHDPPEQRWKSN